MEDPHDPLCVKLRTRYVHLIGNSPVHWILKLQTEIAISTMEAEYIALSTSMLDLIPLCTLIDEVKDVSCFTLPNTFKSI